MSPVAARAKERAPRHARAGWRSFIPLFAAFAAIAVGFFGSTIYGEMRASAIDEEAHRIETNSLPSVELVVAAESALRHLQVASEELAHGTADERKSASDAIDSARREMDRDLAAEAATGMYPGEVALTTAVNAALVEMDRAIAKMRDLYEPDPGAAKTLNEHDVRAAIERVDVALDRLLALNATSAHDEVARIARVRGESMRIALGLDFACMALAALAAFVAVRALGRQRRAEQAYEEMLETRGAELEVFARRVAHDLLSPLSALSFTLATVKRNADRGLPISEPLQRSNACLKRSQQLVDGVLNFARSAALPSPSERASLRDAVEGAVEEVRADGGNAQVEIVVPALDRTGGVVVACAPGILASVLSNLLRNAVKYIGDAPGEEKRVTIRALPTDGHVRVEIEDTGPGVPSELAPHVFEPYVRGENNTQPGLGLGLATVRRFVEAHGGQVGVEPAPRRGSIFWFELPRLPGGAGAGVAGAGGPIPFGNGVTGR